MICQNDATGSDEGEASSLFSLLSTPPQGLWWVEGHRLGVLRSVFLEGTQPRR